MSRVRGRRCWRPGRRAVRTAPDSLSPGRRPLDVLDRRPRCFDRLEPLETGIVGRESRHGPAEVQRVADLREGTGRAVDRDDPRAVERHEDVPGVAETGGDRRRHPLVGGRGILAGEDADRLRAGPGRALADGRHDAPQPAADDGVIALAEQATEYFGGDMEGRKIAMWGLSFKPGTDDTREAPSHVIIEDLLEKGANISAFDPEAIETTQKTFGDAIDYGENMYDVLDGAEALIICTEWHEFRRPDLKEVRDRLARPLLFDGRNVFEPDRMAEMGFDYYSVGRPHYPHVQDEEAIEEAIVENGQPA